MVEFFAGTGNVGKSCRFGHIKTAQLDLHMGFDTTRKGKQNAFDLTTPAGLGLAVWVLMNCQPGNFFVLLACVCTSFSAMNVGTSRRSPCTPWGNTSLPHVRETRLACIHALPSSAEDGNTLASRTVLLCMLATALGGSWAIEQPGSSYFGWYPRLEAFLAKLAMRTYKTAWWARHYGALTPMLWFQCVLQFFIFTI